MKFQSPLTDSGATVDVKIMDVDTQEVLESECMTFGAGQQNISSAVPNNTSTSTSMPSIAQHTTNISNAATNQTRVFGSHTYLSNYVKQVLTSDSGRRTQSAANSWFNDFEQQFDNDFSCFTYPLWIVFMYNLQCLTMTPRKVQDICRNRPDYVKFVERHWTTLINYFVADPLLFLSNLEPQMFASYMYIMSNYLLQGSDDQPLFQNTIPTFLAIHQKNIPREIFQNVFREGCLCQTCDNIAQLRVAGIMPEADFKERYVNRVPNPENDLLNSHMRFGTISSSFEPSTLPNNPMLPSLPMRVPIIGDLNNELPPLPPIHRNIQRIPQQIIPHISLRHERQDALSALFPRNNYDYL